MAQGILATFAEVIEAQDRRLPPTTDVQRRHAEKYARAAIKALVGEDHDPMNEILERPRLHHSPLRARPEPPLVGHRTPTLGYSTADDTCDQGSNAAHAQGRRAGLRVVGEAGAELVRLRRFDQ